MTKRLTDIEIASIRLAIQIEPWSEFLADEPGIERLVCMVPALLDEIEERRLADTKKSTGENED
jgi:hypothetical protein